jgi:cytidylate kinase
VRAERRWKEHQEKGERVTLPEVFDEVIERDKRDRERQVSPLVRAADAVLVDNTAMGIEETARLIVMLAQEREKELAGAAVQTEKRYLSSLEERKEPGTH